jgi:hypothetical protein
MKLHSTVTEVFTVSGGLTGVFGTLAEAQTACAAKVGTYVVVPSVKIVVVDLDAKAAEGKPAVGQPAK